MDDEVWTLLEGRSFFDVMSSKVDLNAVGTPSAVGCSQDVPVTEDTAAT